MPEENNDITPPRPNPDPKRAARARSLASVLRGFMPLPRDEMVAQALGEMVDAFCLAEEERTLREGPVTGRLSEATALVVLGASGSGKSRSLQRAFAKEPLFQEVDDGSTLLISVVAPSPATLRQLGKTILAALGYNTTRDLRENVVWELVRRHLRLRGVRFLHIDEMQHLDQCRSEQETQKVRDTVKSLLQTPDWPVWLILSGLPSVADIVEGDMQIRRRCRFILFPGISLTHDKIIIDKILKQYPARANLSIADQEDDDVFRLRLLRAARGEAGLLIEYVQDAVAEALKAGSPAVLSSHFATAYERRTGCSAAGNIFLAEDWHDVDMDRILYPIDPSIGTADKPAKSLRPKTRRH